MKEGVSLRIVRVVLLFWFLTGFISCQETDHQSESFKQAFEESWQTDSIEKIRSLRLKIAQSTAKSPEVLYAKAWLADQKGNVNLALKTADSLVSGFPQFEKGFYLRANLRSKTGNLEGAFSDFGAALKRNPNFYEAYINRGSLHFDQEHFDFALNDFQKALQVRGLNGQLAFNLGNAYYKLNKAEQACVWWKKADSLQFDAAKIPLLKLCQSGK